MLARQILALVIIGVFSLSLFGSSVQAQTCVGTLPAANCTLTVDTVAPLTISNGITLTVGGSVSIDNPINGDAAPGDGTVQTDTSGIIVNQNAAIGGITSIGNLVIQDGDQWNAFADIITNNDGTDIDLGAGDGGEILNLNNGLTFIGEIEGNNGDFVNFGQDGNGGNVTASGQIESVALSVVSGSVTANSAWGSGTGLASISVADGASIIFNSNATSAGALDMDGLVSLGAGDTLNVASFTVDGDPGTFNFVLNSTDATITHGTLQVTGGGPLNLGGEFVTFEFNEGSEVFGATTLVEDVIIGNAGATTIPTIQENYLLYDFSFAQSASNLDLTITRAPLDGITESENNAETAFFLLVDQAATESPEILAVQENLIAATTEEEFNQVIESTQPSLDANVATISSFIADRSVSFAQSRAENRIRPQRKPQITGLSSGNTYEQEVVSNKSRQLAERRLRYLKARERKKSEFSGKEIREVEPLYGEGGGIRVWAQVFGGTGEQGRRDGFDGYEFDSAGVSFGIDSGDVDGKFLIGLMGTFADSQADSSDANSTTTEMQTYQIGIYSSYNFDNDYFLSGMFAYGISDITATRERVGGTGLSARTEYDAQQVVMFSEVGRTYEIKDEVFFTPSIIGQFSHVEYEDYRETGALGINLDVQQDPLKSFEVGPSFKLAYLESMDSGLSVIPEVSTQYKYDFIQDDVNTSASFRALEGEGEINYDGITSQANTFNLGAGVTLADDDWEVQTDYNFEVKEDFHAHTGFVRASYRF